MRAVVGMPVQFFFPGDVSTPIAATVVEVDVIRETCVVVALRLRREGYDVYVDTLTYDAGYYEGDQRGEGRWHRVPEGT